MGNVATSDNKPWADGPEACLFLSKRAKKEFAKIEKRSRIKIEATIRSIYVEMGPEAIHSDQKMNKFERRHTVGTRKILVQAFKHYQARLYGVEGNYKGKRAFFATRAVTKKGTRADAGALESAAELAMDYVATISGAHIG